MVRGLILSCDVIRRSLPPFASPSKSAFTFPLLSSFYGLFRRRRRSFSFQNNIKLYSFAFRCCKYARQDILSCLLNRTSHACGGFICVTVLYESVPLAISCCKYSYFTLPLFLCLTLYYVYFSQVR